LLIKYEIQHQKMRITKCLFNYW